MSVDSYRRDVVRLGRDIADLETKVADHRGRTAKDRDRALRAGASIRPSMSPSSARSKLTEQQRLEKSAADQDKKAATLSSSLARKRHDLANAQRNLERAEGADRVKERQAADRQRREDLRHVAELEQRRREALRPLAQDIPVLGRGRRREVDERPVGPDGFVYDACLSFAGEQRGYVEMVAEELKARGLRVFYDADEQIELWGKDLAEHFDRIYRLESRYCVMFISKEYAQKPWGRWERRSALARAVEAEGEYVLPARFDDTDLPGLRPSIGYVPLRETAPATLADIIYEKVTGEPAGSDVAPPGVDEPGTFAD